jgi:hypothetical protein
MQAYQKLTSAKALALSLLINPCTTPVGLVVIDSPTTSDDTQTPSSAINLLVIYTSCRMPCSSNGGEGDELKCKIFEVSNANSRQLFRDDVSTKSLKFYLLQVKFERVENR